MAVNQLYLEITCLMDQIGAAESEKGYKNE